MVTVSSAGTAVGSSTQPVYVNSSGTATALSSTIGNSTSPVYLDSGTITECDSIGGINICLLYVAKSTTYTTGRYTISDDKYDMLLLFIIGQSTNANSSSYSQLVDGYSYSTYSIGGLDRISPLFIPRGQSSIITLCDANDNIFSVNYTFSNSSTAYIYAYSKSVVLDTTGTADTDTTTGAIIRIYGISGIDMTSFTTI